MMRQSLYGFQLRSDDERNQQRGQYREHIGQPQRGEETPGDPRQRHDGDDHQDYGEGGIDHGTPHFDGGVQDDSQLRSRVGDGGIFPETTSCDSPPLPFC